MHAYPVIINGKKMKQLSMEKLIAKERENKIKKIIKINIKK